MGRARTRILAGYKERHHVNPKCMGGDNSQENIVTLTAEEHFIAHQLLVKLHPGNIKLLWALSAMTNGTRNQQRNNKMYGWLRRELAVRMSELMRGRKHSDAARAKMSASRLGVKRGPHSVEHRAKMSMASKGKGKSDEHKAALSVARLGIKRGPHSLEWIANQREGILRSLATRDESYRSDPLYRQQQSEKMKEIWAQRRLEKTS